MVWIKPQEYKCPECGWSHEFSPTQEYTLWPVDMETCGG